MAELWRKIFMGAAFSAPVCLLVSPVSAWEFSMAGTFKCDWYGFMTDIGFDAGAPNILERDLGYEFGGGFDWKLVEGYMLKAQLAYWKPGAWFKYACVDRTVPAWDVPVCSKQFWHKPESDHCSNLWNLRGS